MCVTVTCALRHKTYFSVLNSRHFSSGGNFVIPEEGGGGREFALWIIKKMHNNKKINRQIKNMKSSGGGCCSWGTLFFNTGLPLVWGYWQSYDGVIYDYRLSARGGMPSVEGGGSF